MASAHRCTSGARPPRRTCRTAGRAGYPEPVSPIGRGPRTTLPPSPCHPRSESRRPALAEKVDPVAADPAVTRTRCAEPRATTRVVRPGTIGDERAIDWGTLPWTLSALSWLL